MPLFEMPRAYKPTDPVEETDKTSIKTTPDARPGTSGTCGTEVMLTTNRRQASSNFQRAQRAERAYVTKKRATAAHEDYHKAVTHFRESFTHFKAGVKMSFGLVRSVPYVIGEKRERRRKEGEVKKAQRALKQKEALEERIARAAAEEDESSGSEKGKDEEKA